MSMYGISLDDPMDLYVIAPSWTPEKILKNYEYEGDRGWRRLEAEEL